MKAASSLAFLGFGAAALARSISRRDDSCWNNNSSRTCWYDDYNIYTDTDFTWPTTGNTASYYIEVTNTTYNVDGVDYEMFLFNGQFPGPTIEANWGDNIQVTVKNSLTTNGTSIHWHGMRQFYTNDQDGTNGITECPLAPGDTKTYTFQATEYGTSWYHSHFSAQYGMGLVGPIVIHGPASANYDEELGTIVISDWYNDTIYQEAWFAERTGPPIAENYILNGHNIQFDLSAGERTSWTVTPGVTYLIRLINTSVDNFFRFAIDNHNLTVISTDLVPITPYVTDGVNINIGQRYDVVVTFDQPVDAYYVRALVLSCSRNDNPGTGTANGVIYYEGSSGDLPTSNYTAYSTDCVDEVETDLVPIVTKTVDSDSFTAQASTLPVDLITVNLSAIDTVFRWTLNNISLNIDWENPTLLQVADGVTDFNIAEDVIQLPNAGVWTYWIIQNEFFVPHPMHLHGHNFYLLGQGDGTFAENDTSLLNFDNPPRRDVATLPGSGWEVIAFLTDNPGAWLMHCHIAWHVGEGLSLQFLEMESEIPSYMGRDAQFNETCSNWDNWWNGGNDPWGKTDSGLKVKRDESFLPGFLKREAEIKSGFAKQFTA